MNERFMNRWNTGSGTEHGDWVIRWFRYCKRDTDPAITQMYEDRLSHIPIDELEKVTQSLINPNYAQAQLPSIEAILAAHRTRKKTQNEKREIVQNNRRRVSEGEKDWAKRATRTAYANRIMQHIGIVVPLADPKYAGDFDFMGVANAARLPDPENHVHTAEWNDLINAFEREWRIYASA